MADELSSAEVCAQLRSLGVRRGGVLLVHTSFRAGRVTQVEYGENDPCCARFSLADEWLRCRGLQSEGNVGYAHARLADARDIVAVALEHLALDPLLFLHPASAGCGECDEARQSVPAAIDLSAARVKNMG